MERKFDKKELFFYFKVVAFGVILFLGLKNINYISSHFSWFIGIISPFLIGGFVAFILNIPMKLIEEKILKKWHPRKKSVKRSVSLLMTLVFILLILFVILYIVVPRVKKSVTILAIQLPNLEEQVKSWPIFEGNKKGIEELFRKFDLGLISQKLLLQLTDTQNEMWKQVLSSVGAVFSTLIGIVMGFSFGIYALAGKESLSRQTKSILYSGLKERWADRIVSLGKIAFKNFYNFFTGQFLEILVFGLMTFTGMLILGLPYAPTISILMGLAALIPILGAYIGVSTGAFIILLESPVKALIFIVFIIILQQIDGNLVYPRIVGNKVGLPPMWVIVAITVGGALYGIFGMIVFVPLFSTLFDILSDYKNRKLIEKNIDIDKK